MTLMKWVKNSRYFFTQLVDRPDWLSKNSDFLRNRKKSEYCKLDSWKTPCICTTY
jgi:hypothetical protein